MKLDIGCGKNKREGFIGIDQFKMDGVDAVCDLREKHWEFDKNPFGDAAMQRHPEDENYAISGWMLQDGTVDEVHCSHFLEHLTANERIRFYNELYRVLKPGAQATIIVPHWNSNRAYGDPTHQWPPVSEMSFYYLSKEWRETQAPHTDKQWNPDGYDCHFEATWGNGMHPALITRNQEYQQYAQTWYKEAIQDLHVNLKKK